MLKNIMTAAFSRIAQARTDLALRYPYPQLLPFLQIATTPAEYQRIRTQVRRGVADTQPPSYAAYWHFLPHYKYAVCPFCGQNYTEPVDTYTLYGWPTFDTLHQALYVSDNNCPLPPRCPHFLCVDRFINLHGQRPPCWSPADRSREARIQAHEWSNFHNDRGEVPLVTPWFLPPSVPGSMVIHALPLCGIVNGQFVPRYTVFVLTYFSTNPQQVLTLARAEAAEIQRRDPEYYAPRLQPPWPRVLKADWLNSETVHSTLHQLLPPAQRGQLGWLDVTQPDLPLQYTPEYELPAMYHHIRGIELPYRWEAGRCKIARVI